MKIVPESRGETPHGHLEAKQHKQDGQWSDFHFNWVDFLLCIKQLTDGINLLINGIDRLYTACCC